MKNCIFVFLALTALGFSSCILEEEAWVELSTSDSATAPEITGACSGEVTFVENQGQVHLPQEPVPTYEYNPPTSGNHYPYWAVWGIADEIIPRPYWLHNLEHGGVVFLYRWDEADTCKEIQDTLADIADKLPVDPGCATVPGVDRRLIITEDPLLPDGVTIAAVTWEWSYTASCIVEEDLLSFTEQHYGQAPEDFCAEGYFDPEGPSPWTEPGMGMPSDSDSASDGDSFQLP